MEAHGTQVPASSAGRLLATMETVSQTNWFDDAKCRGFDIELFFPHGRDATDIEQIALDVCDECPVREKCLDAALKEEADIGAKFRFGVRGGMSPYQRRKEWERRYFSGMFSDGLAVNDC